MTTRSPAPGASSDSAALLPTARHDKPSGDLVFTFRRAIASAYLEPAVEYHTTLTGTWNPAPTGTVTGTVGEIETVEVRLPSALAASGKLFARLKVEE